MAQSEDLAVPQLQETLAENLGLYVEIDFLTGAGNLATRDGILYAVGADYVTLYQEADDRYILCAMDSIQFITFYNSRIAPADRGTNDTTGSGSIPLGRNRNVGRVSPHPRAPSRRFRVGFWHAFRRHQQGKFEFGPASFSGSWPCGEGKRVV